MKKKNTILSGGMGERGEKVTKHICSADCFKKAIKETNFGASIFLSDQIIKELI